MFLDLGSRFTEIFTFSKLPTVSKTILLTSEISEHNIFARFIERYLKQRVSFSFCNFRKRLRVDLPNINQFCNPRVNTK